MGRWVIADGNYGVGVPFRNLRRVTYFTDDPGFAVKYSCGHSEFDDEVHEELGGRLSDERKQEGEGEGDDEEDGESVLF